MNELWDKLVIFDQNQDGQIDLQEMKAYLRSEVSLIFKSLEYLQLFERDQVTDEAKVAELAERMMQMFDKDHNSKIDRHEFSFGYINMQTTLQSCRLITALDINDIQQEIDKLSQLRNEAEQ